MVEENKPQEPTPETAQAVAETPAEGEKSNLHLLGVSALLISTKYEEIYPPDLRDLLAVSENKFQREQVLVMEKDIL